MQVLHSTSERQILRIYMICTVAHDLSVDDLFDVWEHVATGVMLCQVPGTIYGVHPQCFPSEPRSCGFFSASKDSDLRCACCN